MSDDGIEATAKDTKEQPTAPGVAHLVTVVTPHRPGWKTTEFWLSLAAIVIGAVLSYGLVDSYDVWPKLLAAALSVLTALGYTHNRSRIKAAAHKALPPLLVVLALSTSACATWRDTTTRSLATAVDIADVAADVANDACKPVLASCIAAKLNPCPALDTCHATRRPVLKALSSLHSAVLVGLVAVEADSKGGALKAALAALDAAREVCRCLVVWGKAPSVCKALTGGAR